MSFPSKNSEIDFSILTCTNNDVNLTLYYHSPNSIPNSNLHTLPCLTNDTNYAYYIIKASTLYPSSLLRNCSVSVFKFLDSDVDRFNVHLLNFEDAVNKRFNVSWVIDNGKCDICVYFDDNCSYNPIAGDESICHCGDEYYAQKCPSRPSSKQHLSNCSHTSAWLQLYTYHEACNHKQYQSCLLQVV